MEAEQKENSKSSSEQVNEKPSTLAEQKADMQPHEKQEEKQEEKQKGYTEYQEEQREREKAGIARYVVRNIIKNGMSIFLDAGSTVNQVGHILFQESELKGLTIMTNNRIGEPEEKYAEPTDRFYDLYSALQCMLNDCCFVTPEDSQLQLL